MKLNGKILFTLALMFLLVFSLGENLEATKVQTIADTKLPTASFPTNRNLNAGVLTPTADGTSVHTGYVSVIDTSNINDGYVMVKYSGNASKVKVQIEHENSFPYIYDITTLNEFESFPLSLGSGSYTLTVNELISGNQYEIIDKVTFTAKLKNEYSPFLYPNQYVNFDKTTKIVSIGNEINKDAYSDIEIIKNSFEYVSGNIEYDYSKLERTENFNLPDLDKTVDERKGLCLEYSSLLVAMLRSQGIPAKLVIGYAGDVYHAWVSVYTTEKGTIDEDTSFSGEGWVIIDPTLAATGDVLPGFTDSHGNREYKPMYEY